jgi:hypothetical protein
MSDENELSFTGQVIAGIFLIFFTVSAIVLLYGYWPDRLPDSGDKCQLYSNTIFDVKLQDTACKHALVPPAKQPVDQTTDARTPDTSQPGARAPKAAAAGDTAAKEYPEETVCGCNTPNTITLNKLYLLLVCLGGFLGGMLYISSSFTAYIGAQKFKRSWKLWYFVKPFTAAGLAIALYFAFRAGLLTRSNDAGDINIYGVMTLALLTGLFTQMATQKLREVFQAAFNPKGDLPDKIDDNGPVFISIEPDTLDRTKENTITIKGRNLDKKTLTIKINDTEIKEVQITNDTITIKYTVPDALPAATVFKLDVLNDQGKVIKSFELK